MKKPNFTIIEDSREQRPLDFAPYASFGVSCVRRRLRTGDYSIEGFERHVFVERKSLQDCVTTLTHGRERFTREIYDRGAFAACKWMVVESSWAELSRPYSFAPKANPESIVNSLFALTMPPTNIHLIVARSREMIAWQLFKAFSMFIHRVTHGTQGLWRSLFAPNAADLAPMDGITAKSTLHHPTPEDWP